MSTVLKQRHDGGSSGTPVRHGFPFKGVADASWPHCPNCNGEGQVSQYLAIGGAKGLKGDTCSICNGVGRVPDPAWPVDPSPGFTLSHGLGMLSPQRRKDLDGVKASLRAQIKVLEEELAAVLTVDPD